MRTSRFRSKHKEATLNNLIQPYLERGDETGFNLALDDASKDVEGDDAGQRGEQEEDEKDGEEDEDTLGALGGAAAAQQRDAEGGDGDAESG